MVKVQLISQGYTNLTMGGRRVYAYKYDLQKPKTMVKVIDIIKTKIMKFPNYQNKEFRLNIKFNNIATNDGWMMTKDSIDLNNIDDLATHYSYLVDSDVDVYDLFAQYFQILVIERPQRLVVGATDENNDCLYNCILKAFNYNDKLMPAGIRRPASLKKKLNLNRQDKIPVELFSEVEKLYDVSFIITGDVDYVSDFVRKYNINLCVKNNHVEVRPNKTNHPVFLKYKEVKEENILTFCFYNDDVLLYDGHEKKTITYDEYYELTRDNNYLLVKSNNKEDLKSSRRNYIIKADTLRDLTKGFINYYKTQYDQNIAFHIFRSMTKNLINEPEELDSIEHFILDNAFHAGLHYAEKGEFKNCIDYDMNSMYCHYMKQLHFIFPTKKPEYKTLTKENFENLGFYPYGLYNVTFSNVHKYWNYKKKGWFTHYDLQLATLLNMKITLTENKTNALLYASKDCVRGNRAFSECIEYFTNLETKETKEYLKPIRNSLWGLFASKNKSIKRLKKTETFELSDYYLEALQLNENTTIIEIVDKNEIFRYPWARCSIFLTAYCRLQMVKILLNCKNQDDIICINTDGFISKVEQPHLKISSKIGDFKIKQTGDCIIKSSNKVIFS